MDSETSYQNQSVSSNSCSICMFIGIMSVVDREVTQSNSTSVQTMQSVYQMKQEQAKILQSFNTPKYSLLVMHFMFLLMSRSLVLKLCFSMNQSLIR